MNVTLRFCDSDGHLDHEEHADYLAELPEQVRSAAARYRLTHVRLDERPITATYTQVQTA